MAIRCTDRSNGLRHYPDRRLGLGPGGRCGQRVPRVAPRAAGQTLVTGEAVRGSVVRDGHGPPPPGELAGDGDVGDSRALAALGEGDPAGVRPPVAEVPARPGRCRGAVPPLPHGRADDVAGAMVPGRLDQKAADVAVAGLGDRTPAPSPEECSEGTSPKKEARWCCR